MLHSCTALASHVHAPGPPQGPTYLHLGPYLSILASTNNSGVAHDAWVSTLLCTLHHHLLILGLVLSAGHGIFSTMPHWIWDVPSSLVAVLILAALCPIICSTLNGPMYWGLSFPGLSFSFRCFMNNSMLSPGPMLDFLCTLLAQCLLVSAYFVSHSWTLVYIFYKPNR